MKSVRFGRGGIPGLENRETWGTRLAQGAQGLHVGDRVHAKLTRTDAQRGFIDFARA